MIALLDTDVCVDLLRQREPLPVLLARLRSLVDGVGAGEVGMSAITLAELQEGVNLLGPDARRTDTLMRFGATAPVLPFDDRAAAAYGRLVATAEYRRQRIGALDELIAAHALALDACVVTGNTREFGRIGGLRVVAWTRKP